MPTDQLPQNICIIDDDADFADFLESYLAGRGLRPRGFRSAEDFLSAGSIETYDFFIIDLGLPQLDGVDLITLIRSRNNAGILVISGRVGPDAFISALTAGADMMLNKPVRFDQVFHAIQTIARRVPGHSAAAAVAANGAGWRLTADRTSLLSPANVLIPLTPVEGRIITRLMESGQAAVSRADLTVAAGISGDADQRNLDASVFRLRRKIEQQAKVPAPVRTAHGIGYQLAQPIAEGGSGSGGN